jgi:citrate lyase beta subunit
MNPNVLDLGASLYVPLNKVNLSKLFNEFSFIKSVIIDCEDSITDNQLLEFDRIINDQLWEKNSNILFKNKLIFLRVRDSSHFLEIKKSKYKSSFDGFVLPKFSHKNAQLYCENIEPNDKIMPVLETFIYEQGDLDKTYNFIDQIKNTVVCTRIGANDILGYLGLRRPNNTIIYNHPLFSKCFTDIYFRSTSLNLPVSGPVFDFFSNDKKSLLELEVEFEKEMGIYTKSAIHPNQVEFIQNLYKITKDELDCSNKVLNISNAVASHNEVMIEKTTHTKWANSIKNRHHIYGVKK